MKTFNKNTKSGRWTLSISKSEAIISNDGAPDYQIIFTPQNTRNGHNGQFVLFALVEFWLNIR